MDVTQGKHLQQRNTLLLLLEGGRETIPPLFCSYQQAAPGSTGGRSGERCRSRSCLGATWAGCVTAPGAALGAGRRAGSDSLSHKPILPALRTPDHVTRRFYNTPGCVCTRSPAHLRLSERAGTGMETHVPSSHFDQSEVLGQISTSCTWCMLGPDISLPCSTQSPAQEKALRQEAGLGTGLSMASSSSLLQSWSTSVGYQHALGVPHLCTARWPDGHDDPARPLPSDSKPHYVAAASSFAPTLYLLLN